MSERPKSAVFLENAVYRRNRLIDAARMLPFAGVFLFIMPAIFVENTAPTASRWVFLFVAWVILIIVAALVSRALRKSEFDTRKPD